MNSTAIAERWAERVGEYSPAYYAYYGPNETSELIGETLDAAVESDAAVLELGCSSGRHLSHLLDRGYENLFGIDVNDDAFDVMADAYPALATRGTFYRDAIENVVADFDDGRFDVVFSVETLQHIPPASEWVFEEVARVAGDVLVTVENEGGDDDPSAAVNYVADDLPLYYRNWNRRFTELGFAEVASRSTERDVFRMFRRRRSGPGPTETTETSNP